MSKFVDERVVEMSFDNKKFESNVKTSMGTINELKNSLDFSGTANKINGQLGGIDTSGLSSAIMGAKINFSAFEIAAISAIANITNRVVDLGIQIVKSLSIDNVSTGWAMFSQSAISEATLLAQGLDQTDVTKSLDELRAYADETSFSFDSMLSAVAKMTANGMGLDEATSAAIGYSNWAATEGKEAAEAARLMIQINQALGAGRVRYQDWKSIEMATMASMEMKQQVLDTAVAMGTLTQNIDGTYSALDGTTFDGAQFAQSLESNWFTDDVLMSVLGNYAGGWDQLYDAMLADDEIDTATQALEKYGDELDVLQKKWFLAAQEARTFPQAIQAVKDAVSSGYMNIFTQLFGAVADAKILWSNLAVELYDVFMDGIWKKVDVLTIWADNDGRNDLFERTEESTGAFWNLFDAALALKNLIAGAWNKVFGFSELEDYGDNVADIAGKLKDLTARFKEWTSKLFLSEEATKDISNILSGLFSILKMIGTVIVSVVKGFSPLLDVFNELIGGSNILKIFGDAGEGITNFAKTTDIFERITSNIQSFITTIIEFVKSLNLIEGITELVDAFHKALTGVIGETDVVTEASSGFKKVINVLSGALAWIGKLIKDNLLPILIGIGTVFGWLIGIVIKIGRKIGELAVEFKEWFDQNEKIQNGLIRLKDTIKSIGAFFKKAGEDIRNFFESFNDKETDSMEELPTKLEKTFSPLQTFIKGLGDLFGGLWYVIKCLIPVVGQLFKFIGNGLTTIGDKLKEMFTKDDGEVNFAKLFSVGMWAAIAVGIVRFADFLRSITAVFRDAMDSMFSYMNSKAMMQYLEAIKTMAISILLMVGALLILGTMDEAVLKKSLLAMGILIGFIVGTILLLKNLLSGTVTTLKKGGLLTGAKKIKDTTVNLVGLGVAFLGIGVAILLLSTSLKMISKLDPETMMTSLGIIAIMMVMMVSVMKLVGESEKGTNKAVKSMVKVAISVALLARPLKKIGSIDTETGIKGLIGIATLMTILTLYSRFSGKMSKSEKSIVGVISMAVALTILLIPLNVIGNMEIGKIVKALITISSIFMILVVINKILDKKLTKARMENMTRMMWSLIPMAIGMLGFAVALIAIGNVPFDTILIGLGGMLLTLSMLVIINKVTGKKLTKPRMKNMTRMFASLIPLAIGMLTLGVALTSIASIPFTDILIGLGTMVATLLILAGVNKLLQMTGGSSWSLIILGASLIVLSGGLLALSVALIAIGNIELETIATGLLAILGVFLVLAIAGLLLKPLVPVLLALSITFGLFALGVFLLASAFGILAGLVTVSAAVFAVGMIAIAEAIKIAAPAIMSALGIIVKGIIEVLTKAIPSVVDALILLVEELLDALVTLLPKIIETTLTIIRALLVGIETIFPEILSTIDSLIVSLLDSLIENVPKYMNKGADFIIGIIKALRERLPEIMMEMTFLIADFIDGTVAQIVVLIPRLINAGFDLIIGLIDGIGQAVVDRAPELREHINTFCENIWTGIKSFFGINSPSTKMMEIAGYLVSGLVKGLTEGLPNLLSDIGDWAGDVLSSIGGFFEKSWDKGKSLLNGIKDGAKSVWSTTKTWFKDTASDIAGFFSDKASDLKESGKNLLNNIKEGAKSAWEATDGIRSWFKEKADSIAEFFEDPVGNLKEAGENLINGLAAGMSEKGATIKETVDKVAGDITGWFKKVFGINSPSKVFAEMGEYLDLGLAKGIEENSDVAQSAAKTLGDDTAEGMEKSGLSKVLMDLNDSLESDFDNEIIIRPVLDLSEIQNGKNKLFSMMNDLESYSVDGSNSLANGARDSINTVSKVNKVAADGGRVDDSIPEVINNTFNITGSDPKEIAVEVSKIIQVQVDRRKAKWAV